MKKTILSLTSLFLILFARAQSPAFQFARQMGGTLLDRSNAIAVDSLGNIYVTGQFYGTADFNPGTGTYNLTSTGSYDCYIVKLDPEGNFIWAKQIASTQANAGNSITSDAFGYIYVAGYFQGTVDLNPNAGVSNFTSAGETDVFILKLDTAGNYIWAKQMGGLEYEECNSIYTDAKGNIYTTGNFSVTADFNPGSGVNNLVSVGDIDVFISKLDSSGSFVWAKRLGGTLEDNGECITVDRSGNIYTAGQFNGIADFDPGTGTSNLTSAGDFDIFISKLNSSGTFVWAKRTGGSLAEGLEALAIDSIGNVYYTGSFGGTTDFDPGTGTNNLTAVGADDIFIVKLSTAGNFAWAKSIGGNGTDYGQGIYVDSFSNVYLTGVFSSTVDFDPGAGTNNHTSLGSYDIFLLKLSNAGNLTWVQQFGGKWTDNPYALTLDNKGNILTTGFFEGTADLNPGADSLKLTSAGDLDIFVHKMSQCMPSQNPVNLTTNANLNICYGKAATLKVKGSGTFGWYSSKSGGAYLASGSSYKTPSLKTNTTFFVQDSGCMASLTRTQIKVNVQGKIDTSITVTGTTLKANQTAATYQWIDCNNNKKPLSGETGQTYKANTNGSYSVIITTGACSDTGLCFKITTAGVNKKILLNDLLISPNPSTGIFNITLSYPSDKAIIEIYNTLGILVYKSSDEISTIDLSNYTNGLYILKVKEGNRIYIQKIVKE